MGAKTWRPNEPASPRVMSNEEIEAAGPHVLEEALAAHEGWADRLMAADDPGRGLPPAQAEAARSTRLRELEAHREMVDRLRSHWQETAPEEQAGRALFERFRSVARRKAAALEEQMGRPDSADQAQRRRHGPMGGRWPGAAGR